MYLKWIIKLLGKIIIKIKIWYFYKYINNIFINMYIICTFILKNLNKIFIREQKSSNE